MIDFIAIILLSLLTTKSIKLELIILILVICLVYGSSEYLKNQYSLFLNFSSAIDSINASLEKLMMIALLIVICIMSLAFFNISIL